MMITLESLRSQLFAQGVMQLLLLERNAAGPMPRSTPSDCTGPFVVLKMPEIPHHLLVLLH